MNTEHKSSYISAVYFLHQYQKLSIKWRAGWNKIYSLAESELDIGTWLEVFVSVT